MYETLATSLGPNGLTIMVGGLVFLAAYGFLWALTAAAPAAVGVDRIRVETKEGGKKIKGVDKRKEIQEQLRRQEEIRKKNAGAPMSVQMERAGMSGTPMSLTIKCTVFGLMAAMALTFAAGFDKAVYTFGLLPPLCALVLPRKVVSFRIKRLQKKFIAEFPNAIDVLVRGVRTGLPVNEGMRVIAREIPEPVATEFRIITESTAVGVTLDDALARFFNRMPLSEVNFFNIVLTIQKQTGGNLSEALGNLSNVLRSRKQMKEKVGALSMEAKASGAIIAALPFVVATLITVMDRTFLLPLIERTTGNIMLGIAAGLMVVGTFIMKRMCTFEV